MSLKIKVGFTGADSTGKSTLIGELTKSLSSEHKVTVLSIGDIARRSPFPLVEQQRIQSSSWIFEQVKFHEANSLADTEILICDRTVLDIWVFSELSTANKLISQDELVQFGSKVRPWLRTYETIFYSVIDADVAVSLPNVPDGNLQLRREFENSLLKGIEMFKADTAFIQLPSTLKERMSISKYNLSVLIEKNRSIQT